jgi:hypothetical protein
VTDTGFTSSLGSIYDLPLANVLYGAYDSSEGDGEVFILQCNNTIYLGDKLIDSLANPLQSELQLGVHTIMILMCNKNFVTSHHFMIVQSTTAIGLNAGIASYVDEWPDTIMRLFAWQKSFWMFRVFSLQSTICSRSDSGVCLGDNFNARVCVPRGLLRLPMPPVGQFFESIPRNCGM